MSPDRSMRNFLSILSGLVVVGVLLAFDVWLLNRWLQIPYWRWYLANGSFIALMTSLAGIAWGDLNKHTGLISAHPLDYVGACLQLVGVPMFAVGTLLRRGPDMGAEQGSTLDALLTVPMVLVLVALLLAWLVLVMPIQYPLVLVCGAPARWFSHAGLRADATLLAKGKVQVVAVAKGEPTHRDSWSTGLADKPFTLTNLFVSLLLLAIKLLAG